MRLPVPLGYSPILWPYVPRTPGLCFFPVSRALLCFIDLKLRNMDNKAFSCLGIFSKNFTPFFLSLTMSLAPLHTSHAHTYTRAHILTHTHIQTHTNTHQTHMQKHTQMHIITLTQTRSHALANACWRLSNMYTHAMHVRAHSHTHAARVSPTRTSPLE